MINKLHFYTVGKTTVDKVIGNLAECRNKPEFRFTELVSGRRIPRK
ncbi:hypothetical protein ACVGA3_000834 [Listeria monocytogenes]